MNNTVSDFYAKNANENYGGDYDNQHGPRLDAVVAHWGLRERLKGKRVVDIGGGLGFLGKRLGPEVDYWVIDGADTPRSQQVAKGTFLRADLDRQAFGSGVDLFEQDSEYVHGQPLPFDAAFCLETLEHLSSVHNALVEIKKLVKPGGDIYLSIPPRSVWHNVPYPGLMWPRANWEQFLRQMALPIVEYWPYVPKDRGWPSECYHCTNAPWGEKRLLFPKDEVKFRDCTPLEATNL